ncbi:activity-regulated cytoskeleton associated protein 1-like [Choristoneura fumiferana]|uniref:activity-regulated cytoskeleton associated protein 1-like n=1 Tax=Choristoneura fumiferana TaxID=7141 RepID=UPI003D15A447
MPMTTRAGAGRPEDEQYTYDDDAGEDARAAGEVRGAGSARAAGDTGSATPRAQPSPSQLFNAEQFVASFMHTFAQSQAEINRSLIENLRSTATTPTSRASEPAAAAAPQGNFSTCTARFNGRARDPEVLEAFLDAVEVYKECTAVSDEHAVRGLSMLLEGDAAVWWRGVKSTVTTWSDAATRLRAVYGAPRPAYKILREIFSAEQQSERAEVFVCKIRALLVKLPYVVPETMQIDVIYGLLHRRVRKRLPRDTIESVDSLLSKARAAEDTINESAIKLSSATIASDSVTEKVPAISVYNTNTGGSIPNAPDKPKRNRVRCSACKVYGHAAEVCRNTNGGNRVSAPFSSKVNAPISDRVSAPNTDRTTAPVTNG